MFTEDVFDVEALTRLLVLPFCVSSADRLLSAWRHLDYTVIQDPFSAAVSPPYFKS